MGETHKSTKFALKMYALACTVGIFASCVYGFFDIETNPRTIAIALNLNPKQQRYTFDNGFNNVWPILNFLNPTWALKSFLPEKFGGFSNNNKPSKKEF